MKKLSTKVKAGLLAIAGIALVGGAMITPAPVHAACDHNSGLSGALNKDCTDPGGQPTTIFGNDGIFTTVINTMLFIVGILSVIMIIFAGIRYVTAHGDKAQVQAASQTLIYAIVGLVVAILAYAIVNWVSGVFGGSNN